MLKLGTIAERLIGSEGTAPDGKDATAYNKLERLALSVDAPGRSLGRGASKDVSLSSHRFKKPGPYMPLAFCMTEVDLY